MIDYHQQYGHLSGLQRMQRFEQGGDPRFGMAENLAYDVVEITEGSVILRYSPCERHINLIGGVHGGALSALLDTAMGGAVMTTLAPNERHTVVDLSLKFVRRLSLDDRAVTVEGRTQHRGRKISTAEGRVLNADGKLIASGTATAVIL